MSGDSPRPWPEKTWLGLAFACTCALAPALAGHVRGLSPDRSGSGEALWDAGDRQARGLVMPRTVLVDELASELAGSLQQLAVGAEAREAEVAEPGLARAEELALPPQLEVALG